MHQAGIKPDVIFIDADHNYENVLKEIETAFRLFPNAVICGHDYADYWSGVIKAANEAAIKYGKTAAVLEWQLRLL